ncbi:hypothetical protein [Aestuariibacter sp. A3R04]|uniref:hypothetical protein n=1 Tax=Aestuariibacter sp. A3R04 TaxID=2841571 RepID=UPI001C09A06E|nr:hypothetical protein [Aestuariibacter sp. A3R04]MBU3023403.1 hypothetical protein [Aestuariibacter sp. A3R04]
MDNFKRELISQWQQAVEQTRNNQRLRISLWLILVILVCYPLLVLSEYNQEIRSDIASALERESKIVRTASEKQWFDRAEGLTALSQRLDSAFWLAATTGTAKATLYQTLSDWSQKHELDQVQIRLEDPLPVEGQSNLYRIAGQIDTVFDVENSLNFLRDVETHTPQVIVERMEISQRTRPVHRIMIASYFKIDGSNQ